ncbi:MAG: hypothetical protein AAF840_01540, partial [Bacteroidota bacterium]
MKKIKLLIFLCGSFVSVLCQAQYAISVESAPEGTTCNGSLIVNLDEGQGNVAFLWSNGKKTQRIDQLCSGLYSVTITSGNGCPVELSIVLSGESSCSSLVGENFSASITASCPEEKRGSIQILSEGKFTYQWGIGGIKGNIIEKLSPGDYCVTILDDKVADCSVVKCYNVPEKQLCDSKEPDSSAGDVVMIVNEVSNGESAGEEFVELLVTGLGGKACDPVDLRGYILDDNNGDFSVNKGENA